MSGAGALKGCLIVLAVRLFGVLPLRVTRAIADLIATVAWLGNSRAAQTTRTNLALCFPELDAVQRSRLGRKSLKHTARLLAEAGMLFHWPRERWEALLSVTGAEQIHQACADGRSVLILAPHFGNWECLALYLGQFSITALYDPPRIASLEKPLREARERTGVRMVPIDRSGLRAIYQSATDGGVTALLPDQVPERNAGVYASFFGRRALTMTFAHRLIKRAQPVVLLGAARRTQRGFNIEFSALPEGIYSEDPETYAETMNRAIEELIRTDPAQYQWEYKRFRHQPVDEGNPYRAA